MVSLQALTNTLLVQGAHYVQEVIIGNNILFCPLKHSMDDRYNSAIDEQADL